VKHREWGPGVVMRVEPDRNHRAVRERRLQDARAGGDTAPTTDSWRRSDVPGRWTARWRSGPVAGTAGGRSGRRPPGRTCGCGGCGQVTRTRRSAAAARSAWPRARSPTSSCTPPETVCDICGPRAAAVGGRRGGSRTPSSRAAGTAEHWSRTGPAGRRAAQTFRARARPSRCCARTARRCSHRARVGWSARFTRRPSPARVRSAPQVLLDAQEPRLQRGAAAPLRMASECPARVRPTRSPRPPRAVLAVGPGPPATAALLQLLVDEVQEPLRPASVDYGPAAATALGDRAAGSPAALGRCEVVVQPMRSAAGRAARPAHRRRVGGKGCPLEIATVMIRLGRHPRDVHDRPRQYLAPDSDDASCTSATERLEVRQRHLGQRLPGSTHGQA
jgi:hypothetical protein